MFKRYLRKCLCYDKNHVIINNTLYPLLQLCLFVFSLILGLIMAIVMQAKT